VVFVDPAPTTVEAHSVAERLQNSAEHSSPLTPLTTKANVTGQSDKWVATPPAAKSARESHSVTAVTHVTKPVEAPPPKDNSATSTALEKSKDDASPSVDRTDVLLAEHSGKKAGVIRVGEPENSLELETARDADLSGETFPEAAPALVSIPRDYLEGIREWLNSPAIEFKKGEERQIAKADSSTTFTRSKDDDHFSRPKVPEPPIPPQSEIQEFSLSIGSISIVVEDGAPKQLTNSVPQQPSAPVKSAPQTHDAFALTRRYFRGF